MEKVEKRLLPKGRIILPSALPENDPRATRTLMVIELKRDITEEEIRNAFSPFGVVTNVEIYIPTARYTTRGEELKGDAIVDFENLDMAHEAHRILQNKFYNDEIDFSMHYYVKKVSCTIFIGGLGPHISLTQLKSAFEKFGAIKRIKYRAGDVHAYIEYESKEVAQTAVDEMRGFSFDGSDQLLRTDFSDPIPNNDDEQS